MRVGVVVPTYNQAAYLPEALASLHAQTVPSERYEILAVDDCSTDATPEILAAQGDAIYRIRAEANGGCGAAINLGVDVFSGLIGWEPDAFTWASSDNVMYPDWLSTLSTALRPGVGAVFSAFDMPGEKPGKTITVRQGKYDPGRLVSSENSYFGPSFLIRSEIWRAAGPHKGKAAHDYGHWTRVEEACWAAGLAIVYVDKPLVWYRIHDEQTVKRRPELHDAAEQRAEALARRSS